MNSGAPHQGLTPPSQPRSDDEATLAGSKGGSQPEKMEAAQKQAPAPAESSEQSTPEPTVVEKPPVDGPPPLPYNLREHKLTISIFWFLILTECTLIPLIFYYTIANLTDMRRGAMFAIITAMFGFISGGEYGLRGLRLCLKRDEYRPLNSPGRWGFDSTHLVLGPPYFVMTALMIGFSIPEPPITRGLSMIMAVGIIMVGVFMVWTGIAYHFQWRLRWFRLSSHVKGAIVPPLTFCIMEDICGCDGGGGKVYRTAAMARYNASPRFRRMLVQMLWWWAITAILLGAAQIAIIWIPQISQEVVYGIGWSVTSVWGGIGAWLTIWWGKKCIRIEKEKWAEDQAAQLQRG
ncbi:uncharacterized protein HMPREF1541_00848 [Cyphellophora europaea CBS 101466]|uniref:Uncharacterized protein n=1 Tax=Cyphellophora europaea (strain CBS 101466) TaxID=1220924 RepID=W2SD79_CYPE1|nr:uncharacterized protein HMPREF1541_00848 [Cyphellophora europaea CBS 101466]ETN46662.1 hypothetical protein HMPREF1541_00848 [Cyphellophora europaea CBS 101466]